MDNLNGFKLFSRNIFGGGDRHQRGAQHALRDQVALLQHGHHRVRLLVGRHHADGLVLVRIELVTGGRIDGQHLVALQRSSQLAQRGVGALAQLLGRRVLDGQCCVQTVCHGKQAFGKAFDAEFAGFGHLVFCAATGVFRLGLGAQELVRQFSAFCLDFGQFALQAGHFVRSVGGHGGFDFFGGGSALVGGLLAVIGHIGIF